MKPAWNRLCCLLACLSVVAAGRAGAQQSITAAHLFTPPACLSAPFTDVPVDHPYCAWIQQFKADQISTGCGASGGFCPDAPVTRKQIATMLERAMRGTENWEPWRGALRRTLIVNPDFAGPNPELTSGWRLRNHLAEINDASADNPYLLKLEPGVYDLDGQKLTLKPFVDLEGSGVGRTVIRSAVAGGVVLGADDVEVRWLTIENSGGHPLSYGVDLTGDDGTRLLDIKAAAQGGTSINIAITGVGDGARLAGVEAEATATGGALAVAIQMDGNAELDRVTATALSAAAARGIYAFSGSSQIENSVAGAFGATTAYAINLETGASATVRRTNATATSLTAGATAVGLRLLDGTATVQGGSFQGTATNAYGVRAEQISGTRTVRILQARLIGSDHTVEGDSGYTIRIGDSQLGGGAASANGATLTCFGVYDENFANAGGLTACP